jgi:hypothetical protein
MKKISMAPTRGFIAKFRMAGREMRRMRESRASKRGRRGGLRMGGGREESTAGGDDVGDAVAEVEPPRILDPNTPSLCSCREWREYSGCVYDV